MQDNIRISTFVPSGSCIYYYLKLSSAHIYIVVSNNTGVNI